jgi:ABC-type histidine transport system ATPase subunit
LSASDAEARGIRLRGLEKSFGGIPVLRGISLAAGPGEVVAIIGASGSGKSTLLRSINLLEIPDAGEIRVDGACVCIQRGDRRRLDARQVQRLRCSFGMVFQSFNLWQHMTVLQNVTAAPLHVLKRPRSEAVAKAMALLERVGIADKRDRYPAELSGGQQQRAAIARALAIEPKALLFDEPTSALDPELVGEVLRVIRDLASSGTTMLLVTHELRFAREIASRVVFLQDGLVAESGTAAEVLGSPRTEACRRFVRSEFGAR